MYTEELKEMVPPPRENAVKVSNEITLLIPYCICSRLVILLKFTDALISFPDFLSFKKIKVIPLQARCDPEGG